MGHESPVLQFVLNTAQLAKIIIPGAVWDQTQR